MFRLTAPPACCGMNSCRSVALRMPSFSMSDGRYVSTGFGPVSSAVGMFEPVTTTRSTSAVDGAAAPGSAGTTGAGNCANALDARLNGNPTPAIKARRTNVNVLSAFLIISFSIGLVRFAKLNDCSQSLLRSVNFLLQNCASLRQGLQKPNDRNISALSALPLQRTVIFVIL